MTTRFDWSTAKTIVLRSATRSESKIGYWYVSSWYGKLLTHVLILFSSQQFSQLCPLSQLTKGHPPANQVTNLFAFFTVKFTNSLGPASGIIFIYLFRFPGTRPSQVSNSVNPETNDCHHSQYSTPATHFNGTRILWHCNRY